MLLVVPGPRLPPAPKTLNVLLGQRLDLMNVKKTIVLVYAGEKLAVDIPAQLRRGSTERVGVKLWAQQYLSRFAACYCCL